MRRSLVTFVVMCALMGCGTWARADAAGKATVTVQPASIRAHDFNPKKPPAQMPKLTPPEVALCENEFICNAGASGGGCPADDGKSYAVEVTAVQVELACRITVWTPAGATKQIKDHEAGHQAIAEAYYKKAEAVAHEVADAYIGKKITLTGADIQAQLNAELNKVSKQVSDAYLAKMTVDKTQQKFDAITQHGIKKIPVPTAIQQAFAATNPGIMK